MSNNGATNLAIRVSEATYLKVFRSGFVCLVLLLGACSGSSSSSSSASSLPAQVTINTLLSGAEEVPPVSVESARGIGRLVLNTTTGELSGSVKVSGLSGEGTMAHLHRGFAGSNGLPVLELLSNNDGSEWFVPTGFVLDAQELADIIAGEFYLNVHTAANPGGEVRGQVAFGDIRVIRSSLSGDNVVPAVASLGSANAVTTVNSRTGDFKGVVFTQGLGASASVDVFQGLAGINGQSILTLSQDASDASIWRTNPNTVLSPAALASLALEGLYYNVQTADNPAGELRGQIVASPPTGATRFTVTIENVSTELTLPLSDGSEAVPLSPGAYIVHQEESNPLLQPLNMASAALESLAEDGNPDLFPATVPGSIVFNTPVGGNQPGPIFSGDRYSFNVAAMPGDKLSFVTMFVESNDWFYTPTDEDNSISFFDDAGNPVLGDVSSQVALWESGTEVDETPGEGSNQAGQGSPANTGEIEATGVGSLASKGVSFLINGSVIKVTLELN